MFEPSGLLISLPAVEVERLRPSASLFGPELLSKATLSDDFYRALGLVLTACVGENTPFRFIARPEMFTHGAALDWLRSRIGGMENHLCISDGAAVRILPGMRNHVFLYGLIHEKGLRAFRRLGQRAPELLANIQIQINTAYKVRSSERQPEIMIVQGAGRVPTQTPAWNFAWNRHNIPGLCDAIVASSSSLDALHHDVLRLSYWPLTESGCFDKTYMKALAAAISRAVMTDGEFLLIRAPTLPWPEAPDATAPLPAQRILALLHGLERTHFAIPPTATNKVVIVLDDPPAERLGEIAALKTLVLQPNYDFWRHDLDYYGLFDRKIVFAHEKAVLADLWENLIGAKPEIVLDREDRPNWINLGQEL